MPDFDAVSTGPEDNATSVTFAHTIGGGANRILLVGAGFDGNSPLTATATYNGDALTQRVISPYDGSLDRSRCVIFHRLDADLPAAGSYNVVVTFSGTMEDIVCGAVSLVDAKQESPEASGSVWSGGSGVTSQSVSITPATDEAWLVSKIFRRNTSAGDNMTQGTDQVERYDIDALGNFPGRGSMSTKPMPTAQATTMSASWSNGSRAAGVAVSVAHEAAAGAFEMVAEPGSYAVAGAAMHPEIGLPVDPASYAVTGKDMLPGLGMRADPGAYALNGVDAALLRNLILNAEPGAYSLIGIDASLLRSLLLNAEPGSYVLIGIDAALEFSGDTAFEMNAEPGSYALTGVDAGLAANYLMNAEPGSYLIVGVNASLLLNAVLNAEPGAYTMTGTEMRTAIEAMLESGAYAVNGVNATLLRHLLLDAEPGTYLVTGIDAELVFTVFTSFELNAEPGSYAIVGVDAELVYRALRKGSRRQVQRGTDPVRPRFADPQRSRGGG